MIIAAVTAASLLLSLLLGQPLAALGQQPQGVWPLDPRPEVVRDFAPPAHRYGAGHRGVDLAGQLGQAVRAVEAGTVTFAGPLAGRGVVVVSHGETRTTYEPVAASVSVGDVVAAGRTIGTLEPFGGHCPPRSCLHLGLLRGETYLDPMTLLGASPVRLLPLYSTLAAPGGLPASGLSPPPVGAAAAPAFAPLVRLRPAPWWLRPVSRARPR